MTGAAWCPWPCSCSSLRVKSTSEAISARSCDASGDGGAATAKAAASAGMRKGNACQCALMVEGGDKVEEEYSEEGVVLKRLGRRRESDGGTDIRMLENMIWLTDSLVFDSTLEDD